MTNLQAARLKLKICPINANYSLMEHLHDSLCQHLFDVFVPYSNKNNDHRSGPYKEYSPD